MFEAEIKYIAHGFVMPPGKSLPDAVYHDAYYDTPDGAFYASGQELRLRTSNGQTTLTYKCPPFDAATASKEELETGVTDREALRGILTALGFVERMVYAKHCQRFQASQAGLALTITVATVDFAPETFVEIEHLAPTREAALAALPHIRTYAAGLGLTRECPQCYTDLWLAAQAISRPLPIKETPCR